MTSEINVAEIEYGELMDYIGKAATIYIAGEDDGEHREVITAGVIELIQIAGTDIGIVLSASTKEPAHLTADTARHVVKIVLADKKTTRR